jgi:hypothetical protein
MAARSSRGAQLAAKQVNPDTVAKAIAKAVYKGNVVDFRFLFLPFSPAREDSTESFEMRRYGYLLPSEEDTRDPDFQDILREVKGEDTWSHIQQELKANRPAQLPSNLLLRLADNAVRQGKYTSAALAYELLRIRARMQEEFFAEADRALDSGDIPAGVRGYVIGTGLAYDYAAFPEPLPEVADFQTRALVLHGDFPERLEDCLSMQPEEHFLRTALGYLLADVQAAARLESRPVEVRRAFLRELVYRQDPRWDQFASRYREATELFNRLLQSRALVTKDPSGENDSVKSALADEIAAELGEDPRQIPALLLGRTIEEGEWWQYLKDLAYEHPASALFLCRYVLGDAEILVPIYRKDSPLPAELGLRAK